MATLKRPRRDARPREQRVVIACRGPESLRRKIAALARKDQRTTSDYVRLLLIDAVRLREADDQVRRAS